ncbi:conjugative transposon protein TraM [Dyadobacter subterraneus]|uniref:Conjugative transposon protein TraM n=1 Tax=Dyadobacter subterraneus TaxID=2773304 RepID=A0ABR9W9D2_9BACT|nr:conjugative transposon protein TraM [Dyadobacter subterraneus]MBE9462065.1 conjugative transposon protein TraM [Dyadobacter subterraneus]
MQAKTHSAAFLQNRKLYTFLPLLVLPFVTLIYWAVGIKMIYKHQSAKAGPQGLNTSLPDPKLKDETSFSKLSYYKKAADDSAKIREQLKKDPYRSGELARTDKAVQALTMQGLGAPEGAGKDQKYITYKGRTYSGSRQSQIIQKLKTLDSVLASVDGPKFEPPILKEERSKKTLAPLSQPEPEKPYDLLTSLDSQQRAEPADPELAELNGMLEKILDIQHPQRVADKLRAAGEDQRSGSYPVKSFPEKTVVSGFESISADSLNSTADQISTLANGFFSLDESVSPSENNAIKAVVHQEQSLVTGSVIKLRLTADIYVAGTLIPKDTFIYGTVTVNGERLLVEISSIRLNISLFPVKLSVYDLDGQPGIYIPGSISRSVAKQSVSQDIQGISLGSIDPSFGAQAASAGIQAAKTLLGKKAKLVQVSVKAGYQILLKDGNSKPI